MTSVLTLSWYLHSKSDVWEAKICSEIRDVVERNISPLSQNAATMRLANL